MSRWTFSCDRSSMPSPESVPSSAGNIRLRGEARVPLARAEESGDVPALRFLERDADPTAKQGVEGADVENLRVRQEPLALRAELLERKAEALVELQVGGRPELDCGLAPRLRHVQVARVQMLRGQ
jgi:hypothetical protein